MTNKNKSIILTIISSSLGELDWIMPVLTKLSHSQSTFKQVVLFLEKNVYQTYLANHFYSQRLPKFASVFCDINTTFENFKPEDVVVILKDDNSSEINPLNKKIEGLCVNAKLVVFPCGTAIISRLEDTSEIVTEFHAKAQKLLGLPNPAIWSKHDLCLCGTEHDIPAYSHFFNEDLIKVIGHPRYDRWWLEELLEDESLISSEEMQLANQAKHTIVFITRGPHVVYLSEQDHIEIIEIVADVLSSVDGAFVIVKPHPRENLSLLDGLLKKHMKVSYLMTSLAATQALSLADLTISMHSSTILDCLALNVRNLTFHRFPGTLVGADIRKEVDGKLNSIYCNLGLSPAVSSRESLLEFVTSYFENNKIHELDHRERLTIFNAIEKNRDCASDHAVRAIEELLTKTCDYEL